MDFEDIFDPYHEPAIWEGVDHWLPEWEVL
jgi:hypothetical protein